MHSLEIIMGFPGGSDGKESACNAGDLGREDPLEKTMAIHPVFLPEEFHRLGVWQATVLGVTKSQTQ